MQTTQNETPTFPGYTVATGEPLKAEILAALRKFARQRPGLEFGNYGDVAAYRAESRDITRDLSHALALLRRVELCPSITAQNIIDAAKHAYSGRLSIEVTPLRVKVNYCTGQYFPTEYRRAVCAVAASVLWDWVRDKAMPEPEHKNGDAPTYRGLSAGDWLRRYFRREFGRGIASRWFN